jgi:hypothetical protein
VVHAQSIIIITWESVGKAACLAPPQTNSGGYSGPAPLPVSPSYCLKRVVTLRGAGCQVVCSVTTTPSALCREILSGQRIPGKLSCQEDHDSHTVSAHPSAAFFIDKDLHDKGTPPFWNYFRRHMLRPYPRTQDSQEVEPKQAPLETLPW